MKDYDVIVIGSGINSLSAAALLSKARKKVLVLEARENIGGMASTVEFFPGYRCNIFKILGIHVNTLVLLTIFIHFLTSNY